MAETRELFSKKTFFLMTLDPIHVGTGGQRLGRVDNSIVREPGTRLPKIPGTSMSGAVRQYSAMYYGSGCAGSGQVPEGRRGHCHDADCPICHTFGYLKGQEGGMSGVVNIGDARLLAFPVYSLAGPVWVTSAGILNEFDQHYDDPGDKIQLSEALMDHQQLNLGWLLLNKAQITFEWPKMFEGLPSDIKMRSVLLSDRLFSQVVNSNLEVRTSVSINPETGAAESGKLFTYEAIPRATILWLDVIEDNYRNNFPATKKKCKILTQEDESGKTKISYHHNAGENLGKPWMNPLDVVTAGLELAEHLGIGGMGTRGFGRIRLLPAEVRK